MNFAMHERTHKNRIKRASSTTQLATYNAKRHFGNTPEPKGKVERRRGNIFVIQKHDAKRLHYDLRLELDGVLKSWAVTRGPSLVAGEKRLAVEVEDHPIDYSKFEGTIPENEYGGGAVMIWDRGTWQPEGDPHKGLEKGHLSFTLHGAKLHGGWHLVRMQRRPRDQRKNWLLIKQHDHAEQSAADKDILIEQPSSVATGRSLEEIAEGAAKVRAPERNRTTEKSKPKDNGDPVPTAPRAALPAFVPPCLATLAKKAPDGDRWLHEIKFDGYRIEARLDRGKVRLLTRRGLDWTAKFPSVAAAVAKLAAKSALIDGEVVVEDERGISNFSLLQEALSARPDKRIVYYAFDLLHLDGHDLMPVPLGARKQALEKLRSGISKRGPLRLSGAIEGSGSAMLAEACKLGLEGLVSKRSDTPYRSGRGRDWIKTKCSDRQEFVVAGFAPSTADAHAIGALVLAFYEYGKLRYAGRTGTGFTRQSARALYRKLALLVVKTSPLSSTPKEERGTRAPVWVTPKMVVEVAFRGWTHGDRVRQASFQGVREDKEAEDVVREKTSAGAGKGNVDVEQQEPSVRSREAEHKIGKVRLSHPHRVYWEEVGITKRDLASYYTRVWKWMRPHFVGRPLALLRCPEGASLGQCFFQKHARSGIATEHLHLVSENGDKIISVDDLDGLISLVQAGVLEIHTRGSTIEHLDKADRLVFDLDPGPGVAWQALVAAARDLRSRLAHIKLETFVKTSGGKGLHVVLPIAPTPWPEVKHFARVVAIAMAKDAPERYVATATKSRRTNRIFIDYLRNSREATAVVPYSTRARHSAPVSMPVDWSELGRIKAANQFTVRNAVGRLSRLRKDPWATIGPIRQNLPEFK